MHSGYKLQPARAAGSLQPLAATSKNHVSTLSAVGLALKIRMPMMHLTDEQRRGVGLSRESVDNEM